MKFDPEQANGNLIPDKTECDAEIVESEDTVSKRTSKDMIKLTVKVWPGGGKPERHVYDYITEDSLYKLKQIATATGRTEEFKKGEIKAASLKGASLRITVGIDRDKTGQYEDKNVIKRYLPSVAGQGAHTPPPAGNDADVPF